MLLPSTIAPLWDQFVAAGVSQEAQILRLFSYLLAIKYLDLQEEQREREAPGTPSLFLHEDEQRCRWRSLLHIAEQDGAQGISRISHTVGPWLDLRIGGHYMEEAQAMFQALPPNALAPCMRRIDTIFSKVSQTPESWHCVEVFDACVEYATAQGAHTAAHIGMVMTPKHLAQLAVDLVRPQLGERVIDLTCGVGNLLIAAYEHIAANSCEAVRWLANGQPHLQRNVFSLEQRELLSHTLIGHDLNRDVARTTWMRLFFRGLPSPQAEEHNGLGQEIQRRLEAGGDLCEAFDVVLANPPFMELPTSLDLADRLKALGQLRTEALFLEVILDLLKPGGRAVIALPEGFLANRGRNSKKVMALRERLITQNQVHAVISLPPASFLPHAAQATSLLVLTKGGTTSRTWMYEVEQDGFSLNRYRREQPATTDLWDLRLRWASMTRQPQPGWVDADTWSEWCERTCVARARSFVVPHVEVEQGAVMPVRRSRRAAPEVDQYHLVAGVTVQERETLKEWIAIPSLDMQERQFRLLPSLYRDRNQAGNLADPWFLGRWHSASSPSSPVLPAPRASFPPSLPVIAKPEETHARPSPVLVASVDAKSETQENEVAGVLAASPYGSDDKERGRVTVKPEQRDEGEREEHAASTPATVANYRAMEVCCTLSELVNGLQAVHNTAFYAPDHVCFLLAEQDTLWLLAYWGHLSSLYRVQAEIRHPGIIALPMRLAAKFLSQYKKERERAKRQAKAAGEMVVAPTERVQLSLEENTHRRRKSRGAEEEQIWGETRLILQRDREGPERVQKIVAETDGLSDAYDRLHFLQNRFLEPSTPLDATLVTLDAGRFKQLCQRVLFAAKARRPQEQRNDTSLWYNVLFRFEECADPRDQRVLALAGDERQYALVRPWVFPPLARQGKEPFFGEFHLPSWMLAELPLCLSCAMTVQLTLTAPWVMVQAGQTTLVSALTPGPTEIPSLGADPPATQVIVEARRLQAALKQAAQKLGKVGEPWEHWFACLSVDLGERRLRVSPVAANKEMIFSESYEVPLFEPSRGSDRQCLVQVDPLDNMLASLSGCVFLRLYDDPAPYALALSALVQPYLYALQPSLAPVIRNTALQDTVPDMMPQIERPLLMLKSHQRSFDRKHNWSVENRMPTVRAPFRSCTVVECDGVALECICGGKREWPCEHMRQLNTFLASSALKTEH